MYVDKNHQVKLMCLGHPLLEDPAPAAIGNYVAIIPEFNQDIYNKVQTFLEEINFHAMPTLILSLITEIIPTNCLKLISERAAVASL